MNSIHHLEANVQTRQRRGAVRCRRCGKGLTAPESIAAGIGNDCAAAERSGIATGRDWKLRVGDWVTWGDPNDNQHVGQVIGRDGWTWGMWRVESRPDDGQSGTVITAHECALTFAGVERPLSESEQRRRRIIEAAVQNRTGGLAILVALMDTPHQAAFAMELSTALFPDGKETLA